MGDTDSGVVKEPGLINKTSKEFLGGLPPWIVAIVFSFAAIFSDHFFENVKVGINKANLRTSSYETFSTDMSNYLFASELVVEYVSQDWTSSLELRSLAPTYNEAISQFRKQQYVYRQWIRRMWDVDWANRHKESKATDESGTKSNNKKDRTFEERFDEVNAAILAFDSAVHATLRDPLLLAEDKSLDINFDKTKSLVSKDAAPPLRQKFAEMKRLSDEFLRDLLESR